MNVCVGKKKIPMTLNKIDSLFANDKRGLTPLPPKKTKTFQWHQSFTLHNNFCSSDVSYFNAPLPEQTHSDFVLLDWKTRALLLSPSQAGSPKATSLHHLCSTFLLPQLGFIMFLEYRCPELYALLQVSVFCNVAHCNGNNGPISVEIIAASFVFSLYFAASWTHRSSGGPEVLRVPTPPEFFISTFPKSSSLHFITETDGFNP